MNGPTHEVVAEGVEVAASRGALRSFGCDSETSSDQSADHLPGCYRRVHHVDARHARLASAFGASGIPVFGPCQLRAVRFPLDVRQAARAPTPDAVLEQIFVRDGPRCWFVPLREVRLLTSEGNYIRLSWAKTQPLLGRALAALEQRLDPNRYFRANRRQIINLEYIESVELGINGRLHAQLRGGPEVQISRRQARLFKIKMSI